MSQFFSEMYCFRFHTGFIWFIKPLYHFQEKFQFNDQKDVMWCDQIRSNKVFPYTLNTYECTSILKITLKKLVKYISQFIYFNPYHDFTNINTVLGSGLNHMTFYNLI